MSARDKLLELAANNDQLTRVRHNGLDDSPQLQVDIDQRKAQALGSLLMILTIRCRPPGVRAT